MANRYHGPDGRFASTFRDEDYGDTRERVEKNLMQDNEQQAIIDALVAALETARTSIAGEWGEDHPEVKEIDAALAIAQKS
ncbi:hypothetical protein [Mesorhizobium sp. M00.F.Ca.ET.217.01.1.1]|uniref:hypothetical protein n=1 Tax=Mesorhizobium sp. M00.F.Ca.ET.217.01.1.1 TaxID=2500529 RepID=UPI000FDB9A45|nr:hypothetical protein [Mesorhizobium sp. M00.F.Ca.ET.217.01.1.1]TGQ19358.1 hypothetical protein EN860_019720 [Mesorhizobium sp. M00.F.Ca.ET.217.01.1.1]